MPDPENPELIEDPQIKSLTAAEANELEDATFMKEEEGRPDWEKPASDAKTAAQP